jgi:hypothetical protein
MKPAISYFLAIQTKSRLIALLVRSVEDIFLLKFHIFKELTTEQHSVFPIQHQKKSIWQTVWTGLGLLQSNLLFPILDSDWPLLSTVICLLLASPIKPAISSLAYFHSEDRWRMFL